MGIRTSLLQGQGSTKMVLIKYFLPLLVAAVMVHGKDYLIETDDHDNKIQEGGSYGKQGPDYKQGHEYSKQGHNYKKRGHNYSKQGHTYSKQGHNYKKQGHNYSKQGHTYSKQGQKSDDYIIGPLIGLGTAVIPEIMKAVG